MENLNPNEIAARAGRLLHYEYAKNEIDALRETETNGTDKEFLYTVSEWLAEKHIRFQQENY